MAAQEEMRRREIEPAIITSHSLGVYAALFAAGSIDAEGALAAAWRAGELLEENLRRAPGGLLAVVGLPGERIQEILGKVGGTLRLAVRNTGSQFVLGGKDEDLRRAEEEAEDAIQVDRIDAGGALHTDRVDPVARGMADFARGLDLRKPQRPYLCHWGPRYLRTVEEVREGIASQIREPVLWSEGLEMLWRDGARLFVDMGPGSVLKRSIRWVLRGARALSLAEGDSPVTITAALGELPPEPGESRN